MFNRVKPKEGTPKQPKVICCIGGKKPEKLRRFDKCLCVRWSPDHKHIREIKFNKVDFHAIEYLESIHGTSPDQFMKLIESMMIDVEAISITLMKLCQSLALPFAPSSWLVSGSASSSSLAQNKSCWEFKTAVGENIWLLTYAMQYLVDPRNYFTRNRDSDGNAVPEFVTENKKVPKITQCLLEIQEAFEELAEISRYDAKVIIELCQMTQKVRTLMYFAIKKLVKSWGIKENPFGPFTYYKDCEDLDDSESVLNMRMRIKEENNVDLYDMIKVRHPRKTKSGKASKVKLYGVLPNSAVEKEFCEVEHFNATIVLQAFPGSSWEIFTNLTVDQRGEVISTFIKEALRQIKQSKAFVISASKMAFENSLYPNAEKPTIFQSAAAAYKVARTRKLRKLIKPVILKKKVNGKKPGHATKIKVIKVYYKLWILVDSLHENALRSKKYLFEQTDIIRTCYVYTSDFYKWQLKSYSLIEPKNIDPVEPQNMRTIIGAVFGPKMEAEPTPIELPIFYALADFTTSYYKHILQSKPISYHGTTIKLESRAPSKAEEKETWGLVEMKDIRKDKARLRTNPKRLIVEND